MYRELSDYVWKLKLKRAEKTVLLAIATCINGPGEECYKSESSLADMTGLSKRSVVRAVVSLTAAGLVTISRRHVNGSRWLVNHYSIPTSDSLSPVANQLVTTCPSTSDNLSIQLVTGWHTIHPCIHPRDSSNVPPPIGGGEQKDTDPMPSFDDIDAYEAWADRNPERLKA